MIKKYIFIICDGMGDLPIAELGNKTPLEAASTPNLDRLAQGGKLGLMHVLGKGIRPNSDEAHLTIFGYDLKKDYPGRGPIEAAGVGIILEEGDVAIRANLATVDDNLCVIDRRAGRIENSAPFLQDLDGIEIDGVKFLVKQATGYRVILIMRGKGLSEKISNSDVKYVNETKVDRDYEGSEVNAIRALDETSGAKFTADVLQKFLEKAHEILEKNPLNSEREKRGELKGNYFLTRGPGLYQKMASFQEKYGLKSCCIAGAGLYKGLGALMGMDLINVPGATGMPDTDVGAKINTAREQLKNYDFVFVHIKPTDIFGENGDFDNKKKFIEKIDKAIDSIEESARLDSPSSARQGAIICITADHSTPCILKDHSVDPAPVLIYKGEPAFVPLKAGLRRDEQVKFGESECKKGSLGEIEGKNLLKILFDDN